MAIELYPVQGAGRLSLKTMLVLPLGYIEEHS